MKVFAIWSFVLVLSPTARATDATPPVYLPERIQGALLSGVLDRQPFVFERGPASECTRKDLERMTVFRCSVAGGQLRFEGAESGSADITPSIHFTGVTVFYKSLKAGETLREYYYTGVWTETVGGVTRSTPMRWALWRWSDEAPLYYGYLELSDWGYSVRLVAKAP
jgi:hypothetical protein